MSIDTFVSIFTREKILQQIFIELNNFTELKQSLDVIIKYVKLLTECSAVAVRLRDISKHDSFCGYYTYDGFSDSFIQHENDISLIIEDDCTLQCMCGAVLNNTTDTSFEFFTEGGSFWTNSYSDLLKNKFEACIDRFKIRGYCNACGYESIALIPIRHNGTIIGLLQINDYSKDKFTYALINYMEMVGIQIGIAIRNRFMYSELLAKYNDLKAKQEALYGTEQCSG